MKGISFVPLLIASCNAASLDILRNHDSNLQSVLSDFSQLSDALNGVPTIYHAVESAVDKVKLVVSEAQFETTRWIEKGRSFIKQDGLIYESVQYPEFPNYQLRIKSPQLCDPTVQQYSGYLDIKDGKHSLFFWFFESRSSPSGDPLILWLNGGPGCSSSTGLLFELGPCSITDEGFNTTHNPHSWNSEANIIFLDQPVDVGYSYSSDGSRVSTSPVAALDVWAFLELFLSRYPKYAAAPFHIAAESYGGTYAPNIASVIHKMNKESKLAPTPRGPIINLRGVVLANGLTEPFSQFGKVAEYACDGPYAVYDDPNSVECTSLRSKTPTCQRLIQACYNYNTRLTCVPAALYCWSQLYGPFQKLGLNPYDVRKSCDRAKDGDLCYKQLGWIETFMNDPAVKEELGASPHVDFASCNMKVNQAFMSQGDSMHNSASLLPPLLEDGVRLLVYAGNADFMCNFMGNEAWMEALDSPFQAEFLNTTSVSWVISSTGRKAGNVRSAGGGKSAAGNYTFVEVLEAGHMVPYDQPEAALDMMNRWLKDLPFF